MTETNCKALYLYTCTSMKCILCCDSTLSLASCGISPGLTAHYAQTYIAGVASSARLQRRAVYA